jgi:site-specific recombinase XerC
MFVLSVTPHVLRHAYATHSRESIEALRVLMGHSSIMTTSGYRHADVDHASNPLDDMAGGKAPIRGDIPPGA